MQRKRLAKLSTRANRLTLRKTRLFTPPKVQKKKGC